MSWFKHNLPAVNSMPCDCLQDLTCMIATFLMDDWEIEDDDDEQNS